VAWAVSFWTLAVPSLWYAGRPIGFNVGPMISVVWRFVVASVLAVGGSGILLAHWTSLSAAGGAKGAALRLMFVSFSFAILYFAGIVALHRGFTPVRKMVGLFKEMASVAKQPASTSPVTNEGRVVGE
jgi:hypothetical protein